MIIRDNISSGNYLANNTADQSQDQEQQSTTEKEDEV